MTPAQQPKEYIITEEDFARLIEYSYAEDNVACIKNIIKEIRSRPHPPPAPDVYGCNLGVVSPQKECFGKYIWKDSISSDEGCFICPVYGYCIDVSARARKAREDFASTIDELLKIDEPDRLYAVLDNVRQSLRSATQHTEQEQPR